MSETDLAPPAAPPSAPEAGAFLHDRGTEVTARCRASRARGGLG
jgi:hypothetical protein